MKLEVNKDKLLGLDERTNTSHVDDVSQPRNWSEAGARRHKDRLERAATYEVSDKSSLVLTYNDLPRRRRGFRFRN